MNRARKNDRRGPGTKWSLAVLSAVQVGCLATLVGAGRAVLLDAAAPPAADRPVAASALAPSALSDSIASTIEIGEHVALAGAARFPADDEGRDRARTPPVRAPAAHVAVARDASALKESDHYT